MKTKVYRAVNKFSFRKGHTNIGRKVELDKPDTLLVNFFNPFAPGTFSEKYHLKLVEPFYDHCLALKTSHSDDLTSDTREGDLHRRFRNKWV